MNPEGRSCVKRTEITVPVRTDMLEELTVIARNANLSPGAWLAELAENEIADRRLYRLSEAHASVTAKHYPRVRDGSPRYTRQGHRIKGT